MAAKAGFANHLAAALDAFKHLPFRSSKTGAGLSTKPGKRGKRAPRGSSCGGRQDECFMTGYTSLSSLSSGGRNASSRAPSDSVVGTSGSLSKARAPVALVERSKKAAAAKEGKALDEQLGYPAAVIVDHWRTKERADAALSKFCVSAPYMAERHDMVDWIVRVAEHLRLQSVTIHSAVSLFDEACVQLDEAYPVAWRLQGLCALSIAAKYEEVERDLPTVAALAATARVPLTRRALAEGEVELGRSLDWRVSRINAMHFIGYYLHQGGSFSGDVCQRRPVSRHGQRALRRHAESFANVTLHFAAEFRAHLPSAVAAAAVLAARKLLRVEPTWPRALATLTGCQESDLLGCATDMLNLHRRAPAAAVAAAAAGPLARDPSFSSSSDATLPPSLGSSVCGGSSGGGAAATPVYFSCGGGSTGGGSSTGGGTIVPCFGSTGRRSSGGGGCGSSIAGSSVGRGGSSVVSCGSSIVSGRGGGAHGLKQAPPC
ncbi:hypothetical protein JKP88DRAFT_261727 [Tribonema minus]|uniref:Cyclin N-terminal domain-containing protein n=1 Tax=Tribonema minus TaxID=303371 RepID=A0A835ZIE3_9STRA|nr:hypothetical protein JKP88DRAFT_261727 [Tribonema minus]